MVCQILKKVFDHLENITWKGFPDACKRVKEPLTFCPEGGMHHQPVDNVSHSPISDETWNLSISLADQFHIFVWIHTHYMVSCPGYWRQAFCAHDVLNVSAPDASE